MPSQPIAGEPAATFYRALDAANAAFRVELVTLTEQFLNDTLTAAYTAGVITHEQGMAIKDLAAGPA